ncbi:MAG TPA: PAS domain-containing sensor histidine kinase [Polyangia bacterium]|nr:PAS domain-containing sensor histidine kinase [Polyangia bacterium]
MADLLERANRWLSRRRERAIEGCRDEVSALREDRHALTKRLELLAKVSALVDGDLETLLQKIAELSIPELADWSSVDVLGDGKARRIHIAHRDPAQAEIAAALMRERPWPSRTAWSELLDGRTLFFPIVTDEVLRANLDSEAHLELARRIGVRSGISVPLRAGEATIAVMTFITTAASGRHYDYYDVVIAEEVARRAAALIEQAHLVEELKASDARFRIALALARTAVFEQDRELRYRWAYYEPFGKEVIGKRHEDLFPRPLADELTALKQQVLDTGEPFRGERSVVVGGRLIAMRSAIDPVRDESGAVVGILGASTDISDELRLRDELEQAVDFSDRMVAILGHDLRNPLGAVVASAELLRDEPSLPACFVAAVERIGRAGRRMSEMIATLLDVTQVRGNRRLPVSIGPADLAEVSRAVIDELRSSHPDRTIALHLRGDARGCWDAARMGQVISNLVGNALTHGTADTPVSVAIDAGDDAVTLRVHNFGPVISPELAQTMFEPFYRGAKHAGGGRGLGLGLFIVKQIVLAHAGEVGFESTPGGGTSFIVRLPRQAAVSAEARMQT